MDIFLVQCSSIRLACVQVGFSEHQEKSSPLLFLQGVGFSLFSIFKKDFKPGKMFEKLIFGGNILDVTSRRRIYDAIFCSRQVSKKCLFCSLEGQGL